MSSSQTYREHLAIGIWLDRAGITLRDQGLAAPKSWKCRIEGQANNARNIICMAQASHGTPHCLRDETFQTGDLRNRP
jgi:hypothetical protein